MDRLPVTAPVELQDLYRAITRRSIDEVGLAFKLCVDDWIKLRELVIVSGYPILSDPQCDEVNFIWAGTPVVPRE